MGRHDELAEGALTACEGGFHVAPEQRGERLLRFPFRMPGRKLPDAIQHEEELEVHRLLGPERAVVVEDRDAFGRRHKVRPAVLRHLRDEVRDGFLCRPVVP